MCNYRVTSSVLRCYDEIIHFTCIFFVSDLGDNSKKFVNPLNKMIINYTNVSKDHCIIHGCAMNLKINMSFDVTQPCISIVLIL